VADEAEKKKKGPRVLTKQQRRKLSPRKRERQNEARNARNRARKEKVRLDTKAFTTAVAAGDVQKAGDALKQVASRLMSVATKSTMHRKTAARKRSRLAKQLNKMQAGKPVG
jgi:small subunit ribosomal protein S20